MGSAATQADRPAPPAGARNLVIVVLDSLRYDSWIEAAPPTLAQLGPVERRWSYATWTAPSHYNLLMGLLPHTSPPEVYASEYYKEDFRRYGERLGVEGMEFKRVLPSIFMPTYLRHTLGYRTGALVSMPVLNPYTAINRDFDVYELMPTHNDMAAMLPRLELDGDRPGFWLLNVGETHYPYALPDEDPARWPQISGVHGVFKRLGEEGDEPIAPTEFFDATRMRELHDRQIRAVGPRRRRDRAALRPAALEHLGDRHLGPRRALRRGQVLRPRAGDAREGARGPLRRGPRPLSRPRAGA